MGRHLDERVGAQIYLQKPKHNQINALHGHHSDRWCLQRRQRKNELLSEIGQWSRSTQWRCRFKRDTTSLIGLATNSKYLGYSQYKRVGSCDHTSNTSAVGMVLSAHGTSREVAHFPTWHWCQIGETRDWRWEVRKFRCSENFDRLNWPSFPH